ncbi:MAG: CDP-diacylglycerol--glycerol-3-phosphate 3-phosphatidyltransferase, partial [Isosphaeraceae bacterium]
IQGLRSHIEGQGQPFGAKMAGKLKTVTQCASVSAVLLTLQLGSASPGWLGIGRDALTWTAVGLTIYSGLAYVILALPSLRGAS